MKVEQSLCVLLDMSVSALNIEAVESTAYVVRVELKSVLLELTEEFVEELIANFKAIILLLVFTERLHHTDALVLAKCAQLAHPINVVEDILRSVAETHEACSNYADVLIHIDLPIRHNMVLNLTALVSVWSQNLN